MDDQESVWEEWDRIRRDPDVDPIEVLRVAARYKRYFDVVEREAIDAARALGHTWEEIGASLGQTRQAIWQRVRRDEQQDPVHGDRISARRQALEAHDWYQRTRPVRPR